MEKRRKTVEFATGVMIESKKVSVSVPSQICRQFRIMLKDCKKEWEPDHYLTKYISIRKMII